MESSVTMIKKICYLAIIASCIGAGVISIDLGFFQLSLFRGLIIIISVYSLVNFLIAKKGVITLKKSCNSYSIKFMIFWTFYALLSLGWVNDYVGWIKSVYFIALGMLSILIINKYFKKSADILLAFQVMSIMILFHNIIGWHEIINKNYIFLAVDKSAYFARFGLPVSSFNNPNDFAMFLLFSIGILYICATNSKKKIPRLTYSFLIVSSLSLLVLTTSRANILGLLLGAAFYVALSFKKRKTRNGLIVLLLFIIVLISIFPSHFLYLISGASENLYIKYSDGVGSDATRLNLIKNGLFFLVNTFGFGTGAGNIEYWMMNSSIYNTSGLVNIHNWWMEILVAYGLIVFIMYIGFYVKLLLHLIRKFKMSNNEIDHSISLGIAFSMVGFIIGSISSSSNLNNEWLWVFWAIAIAYQGIEIRNADYKKNIPTYQTNQSN